MWMMRRHPGDCMAGGGNGVGIGWAPRASGCRGQGGVRGSGSHARQQIGSSI